MARLAWSSEPVIVVRFVLSCVLLIINLVSAGPTGQRSTPQCVSFCKEAKNFHYEPGTTYIYDYATDIKSSVIKGSDQESQVRVTARVEVEAVTYCDLKLQLKNVRFEDLTNGQSNYHRLDSGSSQFKTQETELQRHSLMFGFQDGKIEQICAHQEDDVWTLNVKRGLISMIQNSLEDMSHSNIVHEIDINGRCPTVYVLEGEAWAGGITYKKIKDLTQCTSRQSSLSAIQSVPYSSTSPIQNIPLLKGNLECLQTVRNKRVENVQCKEEQRFKPFEHQESGAITTVVQSLTYISEHRIQRHIEEQGTLVRKSLFFESEEPFDAVEDNGKQLLEIVDYLEKASFPQVTAEAPQLFVDFVESLRKSSEQSIRAVFDQTYGTEKEKFVLEALPLVGTASSLAILRDLTIQGMLQEDAQKGWLTALAFIKQPSLKMIKVVSPLLKENPSMEALLGISSMINLYCKHHPSCNQDVGVNEVLEKFTTYLGNTCRPETTSAQNVRQMILRLKAIGNTGVLPVAEEVSKTPVVIRCLKDKTIPLEIRLAAIESLRRMPCISYDNQEVITLFTNMNENTEVRIKAFLALMRCTNRHTIELVKSVLYTESVNQVASFVWTYLTNLQETNRPEKQGIRDLLSNEFLKNKFSTDARKFSRNYEASTFWEEWNVGGGFDSDIIFTEESFLPKSSMFNMTLQLFGESVNVLEFGLRAHGMEQLLEKVFGPQGYFPDSRVTEFLDNNRGKREVSNDELEGLGYLYDQAKPDEEQVPGGSLYTRVFGHEVLYKNFEFSDKTQIPNVVDETGKSWFNVRSILDNLSTGKKTELSKSLILLDTSYTVATSSGFPLSLGVSASATMTLVAKGKFNVGRFLETKELDIQGTLKPSSTINVDGTLAVRIGRQQEKLRTGLKLHNTLRSSTAFELNLLIKGKNVLHASINVPQTKQEIIDVSSELLLLGPNGQALLIPSSSEQVSPAYTSNSCSSQKMSEIVGMKLCLEMNIPPTVSFTPLHPNFIRVYLEKIDNFTGYTVDYRYNSDHSSTKLSAVFDTPGSKINRRIAGDFLLDRGMGKIAAGLESISTSLRAEGIYTQFQKNLELSVTSEEKNAFLLSSGVRSDGNIIKPHFLIMWRAQPLVDLKGSIDMTPQSNNEDKISIEMNLKHLTETPVKVVGEIVGSGDVKEATLSIESYILTGNVRSQLRRKPGHWSTKTSMEYSWKREKMHAADLSAKLQRTQKGSLSKILLTAGFSSTQFPDNSVDFLWETQTSYGFCENSMKIGWGKTSWEGHTLFSRQNQMDHSELRFESSLQCSKFNIDYRLEFAHRANTEGFNTKFLSRLGPDNELNANIEYISAIDDLLRKSLDATTTWPNTEYSFKASFLEKQRGDFEAEVLVNLNRTRDLKATALYMNRSNNLKLDHNIEFRARGFTSIPISGSIGFSATEKQSHIGCQVQFEGKKPYSSRISTSLDYSHTKFSHKLEGKVTLNEKKYNGELLYTTNRFGVKNVTLDLQFENHIYIEATLTGMLPDPMAATLLIIPDKDNEPNSQMEIEGSLDLNALSVELDYFGDEMSFAGRYDETSVLAEVVWPVRKKFMVGVAIPKFSLSEAQIEVDIHTPFEGFTNISFTAQHEFIGENLKTIAAGGFENTIGNFNVSATFSSREVSIATELNLTGYPQYQGSILLLRKPKRKSFQIAIKNGEKNSLLDFDFIRLDEGYLGKFEFLGCKFLPEISMEVNHQFSPSRISSYNTEIQWAREAVDPQKVVLVVKTQNNPFSLDATFTSPWNPVKHIDGSLVWDPDGENRKVSLTLKETPDKVNAKAQLNVIGNRQDFRHELDGVWFSKVLRVTVSGGLNGSADSNLHSLIHLPGHQIEFDLLSKREPYKYIGEFKANLDNAKTAGGVKWDFSSELSSQKVASIWGQAPTIPPSSATIQLNNNGNGRTVQLLVSSNNTSIIDLDSQLEVAGNRRWNVSLVLKSTVHVVPSISFNSAHNMVDLDVIRHVTTLRLIPLEERSFWLNRYTSTRHLSVDISVDNLEDIKGTAIVGNADLVVIGKIEKVENGYTSNIKIESNSFHELNFQGTYQQDEETLSASGRLSDRTDKTILKLQLDTNNSDEEQSGKVTIESSFAPKLEGYIGMVTSDNSRLYLYVLKDEENMFDFAANGFMTMPLGAVHAKLTSAYFPSIAHLQLDFNYGLAGTGVNAKIKFQDNENVHSANIESEWGGSTKQAKIAYDGATSFSVEAILEGMQQLVMRATNEGKNLGEISIAYRPEQGDYSYGKHWVYITYTDGSGQIQQFAIAVGVDPKKVLLNVKTPFINWTDVTIDGQMASSAATKSIRFLLQREQESIQGSFESKNLKKSGTLELVSEISVVGFSNLRQMILETAKATDIQGLSAVTPQNFLFHLNWATSNFKIKVETPVDVLKRVAVTGNWDFKSPKKFIAVGGDINDSHYDLKVDAEIQQSKLKGKLSFTSNEMYAVELTYDFTSSYETNLTIETPDQLWNMGGKISISNNSLKIDLTTPFQRYESLSVAALMGQPSNNERLYSLTWDINGESDKLEFQYTFDQGRIELRGTTPIKPWNSLVITIIYDNPYERFALHTQRGDGKEVKINFEIKTTGNITAFQSPATSSILVNIETPVEHFKDIQFSLLYDRKDNAAHAANISISRNSGETEGKLNLMYQQSNPVALDISAYLTSPDLTSKATAHASLLVDPNGESTISAHVQANGRRYEMYGLSQFTSTVTKFEMRTTLPFLRQFKFAVKKAHTVSMHGLWTGNNKQVEVHGDVLCEGLRLSRVSFNVSTPVDLIGSFGFEGEIRSKADSTSAMLVFQNHEVRWLAKLDRKQGSSSEDWRLQVNTPLSGYKHVVLSMKHSFDSQERNIVGVVQLNKKELSMKFGLKAQELNMFLSSELSYLPIEAKIDSNWANDLNLKVSTNAGNHEYGTKINFHLQGISQGNLNFAVSSLGHLETELDWKFQGDTDQGQGWINVKNPMIGTKSVRSSWKNTNWKEVQLDVWMKAGIEHIEKGLIVQYTVTPHEHYGSIHATANYTLTDGPKSIIFEASLDEHSSHFNFDSVLKTEFEGLQIIKAKGQLVLKSEIGVKVDASLNEEKVIVGSLNLFVKPLSSGIVIELDLPSVTDPLALDVSYDMTSEKKVLSLTFRQVVYLIDLKLTVVIPNGSRLVDVNLAAESNVPALPIDVSGTLRMEYAVSNDGTRDISVHLKSEKVGEWKIMASIRAASNLHCKVVFEGPLVMLPSLMLEFNLKGNHRQGITSDVTIIVEGSEITGNVLLNKSQYRMSYKYSYFSSYNYNGNAEINFLGDVTNLDIRYSDGQDYSLQISGNVNMTKETKRGSGIFTISSGSNTVIPVSLEVTLENHGNILIVGTSHEKNLRIEANLQGKNDGPWLTEGKTNLQIEGDAFLFTPVKLEISHFIRDKEYSLNGTTNFHFFNNLESYLMIGGNAAVFIKAGFQGHPDLKLDVKLLPSNVEVYLNVPQYFNIDLTGDYGSTSNSAYVNGVVHINNHKSILNASLATEGNNSLCLAVLDIPSIQQRVELQISTIVTGPQNLGSTVNVRVNDQQFQIGVTLKTQIFDSTRGERYIERVVKLSSNFTIIENTAMGVELFIRKPLKSYSTLSLMSTLTINDQVSTISAGYELPTLDSKSTGLYFKLQSTILPLEENYEFFFKSFGSGMKKVEAKLNYKLMRFDILWDFVMPASVISVSLSGHANDGERLSFQLESIVNPKENIQLSINCNCWDAHYTFKTSLTQTPSSTIGYLFIDVPSLFGSTNEYKISITTNSDGSYTLESSAIRGRLVLELVGDAALSSNDFNIVLKAMGSYGSHYAMVVGSRSDGNYTIELTAESSSLLAGKRVNIRSTVNVDGKNINAVVQCRARRNIHELALTLSRGEGNGKLLLNLESPSFDPAKVEAEWSAKGKNYVGKLKVACFQETHQSEFGINLENFEGKLHIISPLLPSQEFNFHLKSIVHAQHLDVLSDLRIRGSHWRLEGVASFGNMRDMTFKIETRTPFEFLDRITLGIKSTKEEVYLEIHTPASYIPNVMLKLEGIQGFEQGSWYALKPNLVISVPNGKYSAMASLETPQYKSSGLFHILLQYIGAETQTLEAYAEISPLKTFRLHMDTPGQLKIRLLTPFPALNLLKLHTEGEINSKRSGKLQITGSLNSYNGKFDANFDNSNGNMQAGTRLTTNVPGYEKSAFAIAIETFQGIGNGKSFHVEFRKPDWENLFRIDADYRYKFDSMLEFEGEVNVNMDSYMNLPSLHAQIKSGTKNSRYSGVIAGVFGEHHPSIKVETENMEGKTAVFVEGKAGANDKYRLTNTFEMIPLQNDFSFKEKLNWNGVEVLDMAASLSDASQIFEGHVKLVTPWGPVDSKAALTPITFLTMNEDLSIRQLLRNTNLTVDVKYQERKLLGLEFVSREGMRLFEIHNPIRPVSLSMAVEKVGFTSLRAKAGICWNLNVPEKSSIGLDMYMYRRSTGLTVGGYIAGADYGIITAKFEHFLISSKLAQNLAIRWNAASGRVGDVGYTLNVTDRSNGFRRKVDYGLRLVVPSRSIVLSGVTSSEDKNSFHNIVLAWDAARDQEKVLSVNVSSQRTTNWRTTTELRTLEIQHVAWDEPVVFSSEKTLIHDVLQEVQFKLLPSSNTTTHLTLSSTWENGDWSNFVTSVVQPASKISVAASYNMTEQNKFIKFRYMLFTGQSKILVATLDRNSDSQKMLLHAGDFEKPKTIISIDTTCSLGEHSVNAQILAYKILAKARTNLPYLDFTVRHDSTNSLHILCGLPHSKEIVFKASRAQYTQTVTDVNFLLRLNSSNLLSTRVHWRPEVFDEMVAYDWIKGSKYLAQNILPSFPEISTAIKLEIEGHWNMFSPPVKNFLGAVYRISAYEINLMIEEIQVVGQRIQQLYAMNAFYIKDIVDLVRASFSPLIKIVQTAVARISELCKSLCYYMMNAGKLVSNLVVKYYGRLETLVMQSWEDMEQKIIRIWKSNACWIQTISEELEELVDALMEALEGKIELLESKLMAVGIIKNLLNIYRDYVTWLDELPIDDYVSAIEDFFEITVWSRVQELLGPYIEVVQNFLDDEYLKELMETPPFPYIRFVLRQTKNAFVRLWDLIELETKVKDLVRHALKNVDGLMQRNFPTWELVWEIDDGVIEYDQSLSLFEWMDFTQVPRWRMQSQETEEVNQITNLYYQILDYLENLKPVFDMRIRDILPPFGGLAMMAGDHHYYTFDKKYFRFAGECSYVLVADLLHNGFSFIVNYQTRDGAIRKKSYSIALPDHNIEFDAANFKVTVDSKKVELPTKVDTVYIRRQETRLDIYDVRGYQITCTLSPSVCTFSTSGWYYGKLAGLLGTYDNEPINDFRSPDGQIISDVPTFAYSWRVGKNRNQCRMKNFAKDDDEPTDVDNICYDLLANRASPLRPCFNTVDTTIFMEMCKYDISKNVNSASRAESACTSMSAYVTECQKHNVDVWMPPTCVRCKLEDGAAFTTGENVTLEIDGVKPPPSSSDIVILLEEQDCMDQMDLSSVISKLEAALRNEGIVDNRYAIVGFGGEGIHHDAHIQTSSASVWSHSTLFKVPEKANSTAVKKPDLYSAVHFASTMTYRAGVSKTLLAITCGDEKCGDSFRYADTLTLLVENDFKLHMLTPKPFTLKGKKKQDETNKIYGFDANGVYTAQHAKRGELAPDPSFKRHLNLPKDLCTPLAVETNGTRFSTDQASKKMLDVWSRRVAKTAHPSKCQRCECVPDRNGGSRLMCYQCVSPSIWRFMEEWKRYQSQEMDDVFGLEILETEAFMIPTN